MTDLEFLHSQKNWALKILAEPNVVWANGRDSHDVATEVLESTEDKLIDYLGITMARDGSFALCHIEPVEIN